MADRSTTLTELSESLEKLQRQNQLASESGSLLQRQIDKLRAARYETDLEAFGTFLPPRLVRAAERRRCVVFFGAGVSAEAGAPLWWDLLSSLGVSPDLVSEPELEHDPLTAAEVLAYQIGMPNLDEELRAAIGTARTPAAAHFLLAHAYQDVYITTNYDRLFEDAWERVHSVKPRVVTTDADLAGIDFGTSTEKSNGSPILFKLHGSVDRDAEELILTRSQYRRHYRTNREMFDCVRACLGNSHTLFVGFGHRDPEITRLVEDVIHTFESNREEKSRPAFYSLQFNMGERTPEIFAARGIVALRPKPSLQTPDDLDPRTVALTRSLIEILAAVDSEAHRSLDIDEDLSAALSRLEAEVKTGIEELSPLAEELAGQDGRLSVSDETLRTYGEGIEELAGQGLYVLNAADEVVNSWQMSSLTNPKRRDPDLHKRPYIRQARTYREPFVSTSIRSVFNGHATSFLCVPILGPGKEYRGLVFSAFQVGNWKLPLELQREVREAHPGRDVSFLLVDSNGMLLMPPNLEFESAEKSIDGEPGSANVGFEFERLKRLSRRDKLVERIRNNIVPLAQDDDVLPLGDIALYSIVAEVPRTRWKLALSIPTHGGD